MSILVEATVKGLWEEKDVSISFDPQVNFLIGANGSGKTTLLGLIASALSSDYEGLLRSPFSTIECFVQLPGDLRMQVRVQRPAEEAPRISFHYTIRVGEGPEQHFELVSARYLMPPSARVRMRSSSSSVFFEGELSPLNEYVKLKWLTVHRLPSKSRNEERPAAESSVDRRLTALSNQLVRYFSKLATQREQETNRFLRQMLAALVYNASEFSPLARAKELDLPAVQASIEALLDTFLAGGAKKNRERLKEHFRLANEALDEKSNYTLDELVALAAVLPMQRIIEEWESTQRKQERIAKPRTEFLDTINGMYRGKGLSLNTKNELEVDLRNGKHLPLVELSSGEKQLLILFAEALLQEKESFIYIADEPELSLHVSWQEQLTRNLLRINPNAQIIFATHSPDIVSEYGNRTIDMESLVS